LSEKLIEYFAHSLEGQPKSKWQPLKEHLQNVAEMAAGFAEPFGGEELACLAGLWHDLGKYAEEFQEYLKEAAYPDVHKSETVKKIDHTSAGAQHAVLSSKIIGHLLAYIISGHHAGLLNGRDTGACLEKRLKKRINEWKHGLNEIPYVKVPQIPAFLGNAFIKHDEGAFPISFFIRMIFSCLVDADFLDTERFMDAERSDLRDCLHNDVFSMMEQALNNHMKGFSKSDNSIDIERNAIRNACIDSAYKKPGLFTLTVPTGGGKTLSSLAFSLRHAVIHGMNRIIYVIPFTSIIEQNASVFRNAMKSLQDLNPMEIVLEHHSNFDPNMETTRTRLMTENWDAPLIVTTAVQFYESLFSSKTSRIRKLHRMSKAVIILDEAQTLPVDYIKPCLSALKELTDNYNSTVVLCTATQPAIGKRNDFLIGLDLGLEREIIPDPKSLYQRLRRVKIENIGEQTDSQIAEKLLNNEKVLCIVNTRKHAKLLYEAIGEDESHFHLSALMCPIHRRKTLEIINQRLGKDLPCRLISTQLIEAGVDIDFPIVYRSSAGVDSIAQAAGRCNRNGRQSGGGKTYVFRSEHNSSERFLSDMANCGKQIMELYDDPLSLEAVEHFFKLYYWDQSYRWDKNDIMKDYHLIQDGQFPFSFSFKHTDHEFHLIEQQSKPLIIPWKSEGVVLCEKLRSIPNPPYSLRRNLQQYTVQIPERVWNEHFEKSFDWFHDQFAILVSTDLNYSDQLGLCLGIENINSDSFFQ